MNRLGMRDLQSREGNILSGKRHINWLEERDNDLAFRRCV